MNFRGSKILVTGCAGFIGMHTALRLVEDGAIVHGIDNLNDHGPSKLKLRRLEELGIFDGTFRDEIPVQSALYPSFSFSRIDLENSRGIHEMFSEKKYDYIVHLAAQAGVRYSMENPQLYVDSNVTGFLNILEASRLSRVKHLVYASSSSVYGLTDHEPFTETQSTDTLTSLYAATKKSNELMAHVYSHLYNLPTTGLRFFTVYGPWGRPDMALFRFTSRILDDQPIEIFGDGNALRDFTYVDDVVESIARLIVKPAGGNVPPFRILNIGNASPVSVKECVATIEAALGKKARKIFTPMHKADVYVTHADVSALKSVIGYEPSTSLGEGVKNFVEWYLKHYAHAPVATVPQLH